MKNPLLISAIALVSAAFVATAQENYTTNWSGHRNVIINTTGSGAGVFQNITGFPVLVRLDSTSAAVFTASKANGADIRFTKANNTTRLHHEIEKWDSAGRVAAVWVRVDTVYGNRNNQSFRMHWGNTAAADSSNSGAVFNTAGGFRAVWHMNDTGNVADATPSNLTAIANGTPAAATGMVGGARSFNGSSSFFSVAGGDTSLHFPAFGNFSLSAWVKPNTVTGDATLISKGDNAYALKLYRSSNYEFFDFQDAWVASVSTTMPEANMWVHLFAVNDGVQPKLYVNGVLENEFSAIEGSGGRIDTYAFNIGREPQANGGRRYFNGVMDEVRVHNVSRSAAWARLEYHTQRAGQTVVTLSETIPAIDTTAVPGAPTAVTATASTTVAGMVTVSWTAPAATGGSPITGYKAVAVSDTSKSCTTTGMTSCIINGLTVGSSQTFTVRASNLVGTGAASTASAAITMPVSLRGTLAGATGFSVKPMGNGLMFNVNEQSAAKARVTLVDMWGRTVWSTVADVRSGHPIVWNGRTLAGQNAVQGVYAVRITLLDETNAVKGVLERKVPLTR